jgi:hypothetical protein
MPATIITVDFRGTRKVIGHECIPKRTAWNCDVCGKEYINIEGAEDNIRRIDIDKDVMSATGKKQLTTTIKVCENCCIQIGNVFKKGE